MPSPGWLLLGLAGVGALLYVLLSEGGAPPPPPPTSGYRRAFAELGRLVFFAAVLVLLLHLGGPGQIFR